MLKLFYLSCPIYGSELICEGLFAVEIVLDHKGFIFGYAGVEPVGITPVSVISFTKRKRGTLRRHYVAAKNLKLRHMPQCSYKF